MEHELTTSLKVSSESLIYSTVSLFDLTEFLEDLFKEAGFVTISNEMIDRKTVNVKEGVNVGRIFIQAKFRKPTPS